MRPVFVLELRRGLRFRLRPDKQHRDYAGQVATKFFVGHREILDADFAEKNSHKEAQKTQKF
jgi:hypothetical protein